MIITFLSTPTAARSSDLIVVDMLRTIGVIDKIKSGDIASAMPKAALKWAALPEGPGLANHYPPQPYVEYSEFLATYKAAGGTGQ
ncbi:hypothetical protein ASD92_26035 [Massilia sp. Root1485]|nr:hypothetical protein ASD92_26035 [Massilia sp. Root1485]